MLEELRMIEFLKDEKIIAILGGFIIIIILCIWSYFMPSENIKEVLLIVKEIMTFITGGIFGAVGFGRK